MPRPIQTSSELSMLNTETMHTVGYEMAIYIQISLVNTNQVDRVNAICGIIAPLPSGLANV